MSEHRIIPGLQPLTHPISDLHLATKNPRRGDVEAIARSLAEFGQHKPLVATRDGEVIIGNHTLQAAISLGWEEIAVVYTDDDPSTAKARLLADNKTSERGRTDNAEVAALLAEISLDADELLAATGYQDGEIEALLRLTAGVTPMVYDTPDEQDDHPIGPSGLPDLPTPPRVTGRAGPGRTGVRSEPSGHPVPESDPELTTPDRTPASNRGPASNRKPASNRSSASNRSGASNGEHGPAPIPGEHQLHLGDCRDVMAEILDDASIDAIITDPGVGDSKDNDGWWRQVPGVGFWSDLLRVAKPGTHMCVFAGRRTWHRLAICAEDAGWELRDSLMWVYGKGMPMALDIGQAVDRKMGGPGEPYFRNVGSMTDEERVAYTQQGSNPFYGYGTELKPSWEPILLFRKPVQGTIAENVMRYGPGSLNIDATRVGDEERDAIATWIPEGQGEAHGHGLDKKQLKVGSTTLGRWPGNAIFEEGEATEILDEQSGRAQASRFFYCPKASKREKDEGLLPGTNDHKAVKPTAVVEWLIDLITPGATSTGSTPMGAATASTGSGVVLDPFCGTGSTGVAANRLGFGFVGIDHDAHVINDIAAVRLAHRRA